MGQYIDYIEGVHIGTSAEEKVNSLKNNGGVVINTPTEFQENLVCVIDNGWFGAAGHAYDEREMKIFLNNDGRPKVWMIVPNAEKLVN